jgi:hypothetical protein
MSYELQHWFWTHSLCVKYLASYQCTTRIYKWWCRILDIAQKFIPISNIMSDSAHFSPISDVPISGLVRYRWSRISEWVPTYDYTVICTTGGTCVAGTIIMYTLYIHCSFLLAQRMYNTNCCLVPSGVQCAVGSVSCWKTCKYYSIGKRISPHPNPLLTSWICWANLRNKNLGQLGNSCYFSHSWALTGQSVTSATGDGPRCQNADDGLMWWTNGNCNDAGLNFYPCSMSVSTSTSKLTSKDHINVHGHWQGQGHRHGHENGHGRMGICRNVGPSGITSIRMEKKLAMLEPSDME